MKNQITLLIAFTAISLHCFSQDTIKVEPSIFYSKEKEKQLTGKGVYKEYSKEVIIFSENHKREECCYYVDSIVRKCIGIDYKNIGDSILLIGELDKRNDLEHWNINKLKNGNYLLERINNGTYELWESKKLVPPQPLTSLITITLDKKDTLWTTSFNSNCNQYPNYRKTKFYKKEIFDKVYEYDKVDSPPTQLNGKALKKINIQGIAPCFSEPAFVDITLVAMIITKEGDIQNIEQAIGTLSEGCPFTMQEIIKEIKSRGKVNPAVKGGKKVNVRWFVEVNNEHRNYIHPVIEDNKRNRKKYIRKKKAAKN